MMNLVNIIYFPTTTDIVFEKKIIKIYENIFFFTIGKLDGWTLDVEQSQTRTSDVGCGIVRKSTFTLALPTYLPLILWYLNQICICAYASNKPD